MANDREDEGIAAFVKHFAEDIGDTVRRELAMARREMTDKAKNAGMGAGMLGGSAIAALLMLGSLTALLVIALTYALPAWAAALIVTVFWAAVTAVLALRGKQKIADAGPLVPEQTIESVKEDVAELTGRR